LKDLLSRQTGQLSPQIKEGWSFLQELRKNILEKEEKSGKYNSNMDIDLDKVRHRLIDCIEAIRK
jgi:hypothetical protein